MRDAWNPDQYQRFKAERAQPFRDLLALVHRTPSPRVLDLGSGTGELTRELHQALGARETVGIDSSAAMLARSAPLASGSLRFEHADIATFEPDGPFDLVFSNAALHWVDGHAQLFPRLLSWLPPGGQLAVQMPANHDHPTHTEAAALAALEPFASALGGRSAHRPVRAPEEYASILARHGAAEQHVRLQVYPHWLSGREQVLEWVKGTLLVAYEERLPSELFEDFLGRYARRLDEVLPDERPFFYPFKRLLIWARSRNPSR